MGKLAMNYLQMLIMMDFLNKRKQENVMNFQTVQKMQKLDDGQTGHNVQSATMKEIFIPYKKETGHAMKQGGQMTLSWIKIFGTVASTT